MKYRTKLTLALMFLAIFSNLLAVVILYENTKKLVFTELQSKVLSIAATSAAFVDGDQLAKIQIEEDASSKEYQDFQRRLHSILQANHRKDTNISLLYIFRKDPYDDKRIIIDIDTEQELGKAIKHKIAAFPGAKNLTQLGRLFVTKRYYTDRFGTWIGGFVPIQNSKGEVIGNLGVNVDATRVQQDFNRILVYAAWAMSISIVLAFGLAFFLSKWFSSPIYSICNTVHRIGQGNLDVQAEKFNTEEFSELSESINNMIRGLQERERLKSNFARYVSQHVLEKILNSEESARLEGERKKITVLFSDIREFSRLSEQMDPEEVVSLLNEYCERMISIIFKYQGTLDKIMGDGLMVLFGAPLEDSKQEEHAVKAAIAMQKELQNLSKKWTQEGKKPMHMGIGLHTGQAIVGNIGSEKRMEYTAIGDTVNIAFHLEQLTKQYEAPILVSEPIYEAVKGIFPADSLGELTIRGREAKIHVFAIHVKS